MYRILLAGSIAAAVAAVLAVVLPTRRGHIGVVSQTLHFWARPGGVIPDAAIESRAAWRGDELSKSPELWRHDLSAGEVAALQAAVRAVEAAGKGLGGMSREDFPLGASWNAKLAALRREVTHGLGFFVLRGIPVESWNATQQEIAFWGLGLHLGLPGAQNNDGDLLGHVTDVGGDPATERTYKTRAEIRFHCDAADAVGLLTLRGAKSGGTSRIASSVSIFNKLLADAPELVPRLFRPVPMDTRGGGGVDWSFIEPLRADSTGTLRTFYHTDYFRSAGRYESAAPFMDGQALDAYEAAASDPGLHLDMTLLPGDLQVVSNHFILHSRAAYEDYEEPGRKRHLLRLWLSIPNADAGLGAVDQLSKLAHKARLVGRLVAAKFRKRLGR